MGVKAFVHELVERTCRRCDVTKSVDEFVSDRGLPSTLCRECNREMCRERYARNRKKRKAQSKRRREARKAADPETVANEERYRYWARKKRDPQGYILARIKRSATRLGVPFDLCRDDIVIPELCPVLGLRLDPITAKRSDAYPEVDRLVPELGYVRGNVHIISRRANRIKDNGSAEEHERIARWMRATGGQGYVR